MSRIDVTAIDAVEAIVKLLKDTLALNDSNCYPVARPQDVPKLPAGGDYWLTVAPGGGTFEPEEQVPATETLPGNVTEESEVTVTAYSRLKTDRTNSDHDLLLEDARGLLSIKRKVLGALVGQDVTDADGNTFLRQLLFAKTATAPDLANLAGVEAAFGRIAITFGLVYDWDLSA